MSNNKKISGITPARGSSRDIPRKNTFYVWVFISGRLEIFV
jgi:hypothetical protein